MFPCKRHPTSAVFFANLMRQLTPKVDELVILTPRVYIPKILTRVKKKWSKWYIDPMVSRENGMIIIRPYFLSLRGTRYEGLNGILMQLSLFYLVRKLIKKRKFDLILGYNMIPEGIAAVGLGKMFRLPVGFWCIGTDVNDVAQCGRINSYLTKKCLIKSDIVITESKDLENKVRRFSTHSLNVKTFYKGIDLSNFQNLPSKSDLIEKLGLDNKRRYILFAGRLIYDKGIYELADAFAIVSRKYPDVDLIFVGEFLEKERLEIKLRDEGILDRVLFKGIVTHKEVAYYMKLSDLLVLPTWAEGLPNVVMESMALGLPVVASNVGGIPEIIKDGINGLLVQAKNSSELTSAIMRMMNDVELRKQCIANARNLIFEKFDVKKNVNQLYEILENMLKKSPYFLKKENQHTEAIH